MKYIPPPYAFVDYVGPIKIKYLNKEGFDANSTQPCGRIPANPPDWSNDEVERIIVQAIDHGRRDNGPAWTWDPDLDHGRGTWVTYDERIHKTVPKPEPQELSAAAVSKVVDVSARSAVELVSENAPDSDPPADDDEDVDEPSFDLDT